MSAGGSPFDLIESSMMNVVFSIMGYRAEWTPLAGGPMQAATVGYKGPTKVSDMKNTKYWVDSPCMEYKLSDFTGLDVSVDVTANVESVNIYFSPNVPTLFYVRNVTKKYDGKTFEAELEAA